MTRSPRRLRWIAAPRQKHDRDGCVTHVTPARSRSADETDAARPRARWMTDLPVVVLAPVVEHLYGGGTGSEANDRPDDLAVVHGGKASLMSSIPMRWLIMPSRSSWPAFQRRMQPVEVAAHVGRAVVAAHERLLGEEQLEGVERHLCVSMPDADDDGGAAPADGVVGGPHRWRAGRWPRTRSRSRRR